ncbi:helix-turn-helix domain-containing protein [Solilutibacter silvestris]|uniref:Helix-turn-helix protein n=1 Tax=Solilutibacter silvestris TaxID=1645665 RepID=A0A2K1Q1R0_9GAMM|nr:helix-turn-helix transcriptional regulator [Lysobacter silvestris]PNS08867.1 helix-turn-helix protein [Lysobacter silvestris]
MSPPLPERIGLVIRRRREALGVSQEAFAEQVGMHRNYYGSIERGRKTMRLDTLEKLAVGLGTEGWRLLKEAGQL